MADTVRSKDGCLWRFIPFAASHHGTFYRTLSCGSRVQFGEWSRYWDGSGRFETLGEAPTVEAAKGKLEALRLSQDRAAQRMRGGRRHG